MSRRHALTVDYDGKLVTLNAAVGLLRRRNVPVHDLLLGPGPGERGRRLSAMIESDSPTAERIAQLFRKLVGVHDASARPADDAVARELALVHLRPPAAQYAELYDVCQLYQAEVIEESAEGVVVQAHGPATFVQSCIRALERFGLVDVARSGASVSLPGASGAPTPQPEVIVP